MDTQKLQEQTDIIEAKLLQVAGNLVVQRMMSGKAEPTEEEDLLGEAMEALLAVKKELGLASNLTLIENHG